MLTYFCTQYCLTQQIDPDYRLNELLTYELDDEYVLVTTRARPWAILELEEYDLLLTHRVETRPGLYRTLHDLGIIVTKENARRVAEMYAAKYRFLFEPPSLYIMVPTNRCNMNCLYCHADIGSVRHTELDMTEELVMKTIDFFMSIPPGLTGRKTLEFQGGEPLLRYDLVQLAMDYAAEKAEEKGIRLNFSIVSNLTLMQDEVAEDIKQRGNVRLTTSYDGPSHIHDRQRVYPGGKGTNQRVSYWIDRLESKFGIRVGMQPTCTVHHLGCESEAIDEFARWGRNFIVRTVNRTGKAHREGTFEELGMTGEEKVSFWKRSLEYILEKNRKGYRMAETTTCHLLNNILGLNSGYMCMRRPCGCAVSQLTVSQNGDIHGCDAGRSIPMLVLGNVRTHTYEEIVRNPTVRALRTVASETLPKCQTCPFGPYCGYCFAETINIGGSPLPQVPVDPQCRFYCSAFPHVFRALLDRTKARILLNWVF